MLGEEDYAKRPGRQHPSPRQSHGVTADIRQAVECNATPADKKTIPKQSPSGAKEGFTTGFVGKVLHSFFRQGITPLVFIGRGSHRLPNILPPLRGSLAPPPPALPPNRPWPDAPRDSNVAADIARESATAFHLLLLFSISQRFSLILCELVVSSGECTKSTRHKTQWPCDGRCRDASIASLRWVFQQHLSKNAQTSAPKSEADALPL